MSENSVLSLVQTFHNFAGVLFTAGPVYFLIIFKRQELLENFNYSVARSIYPYLLNDAPFVDVSADSPGCYRRRFRPC